MQVYAAGCKTCKGKGAIECPGCKVSLHLIQFDGYAMLPLISPFDVSDIAREKKMKLADVMQGTGKNKKNGNIFERWKYVPIRYALDSTYPFLLGFIRTVHHYIRFKRNRSVM